VAPVVVVVVVVVGLVVVVGAVAVPFATERQRRADGCQVSQQPCRAQPQHRRLRLEAGDVRHGDRPEIRDRHDDRRAPRHLVAGGRLLREDDAARQLAPAGPELRSETCGAYPRQRSGLLQPDHVRNGDARRGRRSGPRVLRVVVVPRDEEPGGEAAEHEQQQEEEPRPEEGAPRRRGRRVFRLLDDRGRSAGRRGRGALLHERLVGRRRCASRPGTAWSSQSHVVVVPAPGRRESAARPAPHASRKLSISRTLA
jgi:hypothetical protein